MAGVDPTCLAADVTQAITGHGIALGGLQLIQNLLAGLGQLGARNERISGWIATADPVQRTVLLSGQYGVFNRLATDCVASMVCGQADAFFLARACVINGCRKRRCSGCSKAGDEDCGTNFHDGLLWRRMPGMVHPGGVLCTTERSLETARRLRGDGRITLLTGEIRGSPERSSKAAEAPMY